MIPGQKLLVVSGAFPPSSSGEAQHALLLSRHLARRGYDVRVLTSMGVAQPAALDVWPLMRDWSWSELPTFAKAVRSCSPDIILLMYIGWIYNDHPMITYAPTIARLLLPRVRFVTQLENVIGAFPERGGYVGRIGFQLARTAAGLRHVDYRFGTLLRDSHRIIVLSEHHRSSVASLAGSAGRKSTLIPPPPLMVLSPDAPETRERGRKLAGAGPGDFLVVYLGYLYPGRGLETLLRAFAIVARNRENARLAIVGGPLAGFEAYAATIRKVSAPLGIEDATRWMGAYAWDSDDGSMMLRAADVYVMPIDVGVALNNSSIGAAATHGTPLIATRGDDIEPAFRDRENVLLCRPHDPEAMAAAITTVMDDEPLRERLSRGARDLARLWYSWETALDRTIATFRD